ncbi:ras-GEF domain-containing family member 1B-like isoform X2 [Artemia franciscana]
MAALDDLQIRETVESLLGKGTQVLDVQKTTSVKEEEVVLVNGTPVVLSGPEGETIKNCLMNGSVPPPELLQQLLRRAGLLVTPVRVDSSLTVKTTTINKDTVTVKRNGVVVDERCKEVKEEDVLTSSASDLWRALPNDVESLKLNCGVDPTIFGTVASSATPKDNVHRRSLPQTHQTGKTIGNIPCGSSDGMSSHNSSLETVESSENSSEQDNSLVYRDTDLVSGSLEALIQHLVPTTMYYPDRTYIFAFVLSSRLFIKPHALLGEVIRLSWTQQKLNDPGVTKSNLGRFCYHLVQLLGEWMETFPYDFRDERVMAHVRNITQRCVTLDPGLRRDVSTMLHNLLHKLTDLEKYEEFLEKTSIDTAASIMDHGIVLDITEVCGSPLELAQNLTQIELERLSYIGPEEFVQAFAKENPSIETSFKDMKKTRNLESYIQWFNRLSFMVATQVLVHQKKKQRVRLIEFWIEVARECFNIGNFNSLMAIIAGLNMSPVSRLKKTWSKVQTAQFSVLEHQMDPSSNFTSYRSTLKAAMWRSAGATDERQKIVIPFFSLLVKDLYFLNEGCASRLSNGHINFEKFWQLAKQVTEFMTWKQVACPFEKDNQVLQFMQTGPILSENELGLVSFDCEPPENNMEKERWKYLKSSSSPKS